MRIKTIVEVTSGAFLIACAIPTSFLPYWRMWGATAGEVKPLSRRRDGPAYQGRLYPGYPVRAVLDRVCQWIVQVGQDRAGFYSHDFLDNLAGCDIHTAYRIVTKYIPGMESGLFCYRCLSNVIIL